MKTLLLALLVLFCAASAFAQAPKDVPQSHWAYQAVNDLAAKGYIQGNAEGNFLGDRALTRYEFATIIARILDNLETRLSAAEKTASTMVPTPAPEAKVTETPAAGVSPEDLAEVKKLVDEFKVELTVIGTRLDKVESDVAALTGTVDNLNTIVTDPEGAVEVTRADVAKLKTIGISGYVQARYQTANMDKEDTTNANETSTFMLRRARVKLTAKPTDRSTAVLQLDMAKNTTAVKDAYLNVALGPNSAISPSIQVGQQNWWFGYDVPYSSSKRETPERALFVRRFFPGERDAGAVIMGPTDKAMNWTLGVYNGTGTEKSNAADVNNHKDILGNIKWYWPTLDLGFSAYVGQGLWKTFADKTGYLSSADKLRYGVDAQYYLNNFTFKGEYIRAKGVDAAVSTWDQGKWVDGYYLQANDNLSPLDTVVVRYSTLSQDPVTFDKNYGRRNAWEFGYLRWLDPNTRMKLFYKVNDEQNNSIKNNAFTAEWLTTY